MIVLKGKKIAILVLAIFLAIFIYMFTQNNSQSEYISTVSLPVSGKVIVVDAGHRFS